jgi:hypothetical protein
VTAQNLSGGSPVAARERCHDFLMFPGRSHPSTEPGTIRTWLPTAKGDESEVHGRTVLPAASTISRISPSENSSRLKARPPGRFPNGTDDAWLR